MKENSKIEITIKFNEYINNQDIAGLTSLMPENHIFIDSGGNELRGKGAVLKAWKEFFQSFPGYKNIFEKTMQKNDLVIIIGYSKSSYPDLNGPAIWTSEVKNGKVFKWQVYDDNTENRKLLGLRSY